MSTLECHYAEAAQEAVSTAAAAAAATADGLLPPPGFRDIRVATVGLEVSPNPAADAPRGFYTSPG